MSAPDENGDRVLDSSKQGYILALGQNGRGCLLALERWWGWLQSGSLEP